jgi:hypothetical protein
VGDIRGSGAEVSTGTLDLVDLDHLTEDNAACQIRCDGRYVHMFGEPACGAPAVAMLTAVCPAGHHRDALVCGPCRAAVTAVVLGHPPYCGDHSLLLTVGWRPV